MQTNEAGKPIRVGQAYLDAIKDDPDAQAALRRAQVRLQVFGAALRGIAEPVQAVMASASSRLSESLQLPHELGGALREALGGDFERLRMLVERFPDLQETSEELQRLIADRQAADDERSRDLELRLQHAAKWMSHYLLPNASVLGDPEGWVPAQLVGEQFKEAIREAIQQRKPRKERMKREIAEPMIAHCLQQRPHDTAEQIAAAVGCSVGVVAGSAWWKLNQKRLRMARVSGADPKAIALDERAINAAGGSIARQSHDHRQQAATLDDEIDAREQELVRQIGEYQRAHCNATPQQIAAALGCSAGDVERRQASLSQLIAEQSDDHEEDIDVDDATANRGKRRKWHRKQV